MGYDNVSKGLRGMLKWAVRFNTYRRILQLRRVSEHYSLTFSLERLFLYSIWSICTQPYRYTRQLCNIECFSKYNLMNVPG